MEGNVLGPSLRRGFHARFWVATILAAIAICMDNSTEIIKVLTLSDYHSDVDCILYFYVYSVVFGGVFGANFSAILAAIPAAGQYVEEVKMSPYLLTRANTIKYSMAKMLSAAICGGLSLMFGYLVFVIILSAKLPMLTETFLSEVEWLAYYDVLRDNVTCYISICALLAFLRGFLWSGMAMCVSAFFPDRFVATVSPLIFTFLLTQVGRLLKLGNEHRLDLWLTGRSWLGSTGSTLAAVSGAVLLIWGICSLIFVKKLKRGK